MAHLFLSLSSRDNVCALALQNWPNANGWGRGDAFIDLHGSSAGERWCDTLRKANASCEDVIFLALPDALDSVECQKELELAEARGKESMMGGRCGSLTIPQRHKKPFSSSARDAS